MKRQLQKIAVIAIIILANAFANAFAQTATWALTAGTAQSVAITGTGISAAPQGLSVLSMNSGADYTGLVGPLGANSQRVRVSSGWPQTSAYAPNRYYEYAVTVTSGTFNSATVSLPMGVTSTNNMRVEFFYSTDNFATSTQLNTGGTIAVPTAAYINPAPTYTFNVPLVVGKTLSVRAFPWYTGTDNSTSRYTSMQNVQITLSTAVVPLKLSSFNASLTDNKAILSWNTSNEINMQGFEVEKATDGKTFSSIGTIAAKNASTNSYSFADDKALAAKTFYRLKMLDKDGSSTYSQVLSVAGKSSVQLSVYPNPVVNAIVLTHPQASVNAAIKIVSIDGKNIMQRKMQESATQSSFDVSELIKGVYMLHYMDGNMSSSIQFIKQ